MHTMRTLLPVSLFLLMAAAVNGQGLVRFSNITELGAGFQVGEVTQLTEMPDYLGGTNETKVAGYSVPAPRIVSSFGVMIWDLLFVGAGAGYAFQPGEDAKPYQHHISGFGHARIHFAKGRFRPFTDLRAGYNYTLDEQTSAFATGDMLEWDGLMLEPALGFAIKISDKALFNTSLGYQFHSTTNRGSTTFTDQIGNALGEFSTQQKQHRLMLNIGFTFK